MDFLGEGGVVYGDNSANRVVDVVTGLPFDRVVIHLGGSGAIDNIQVGGGASPVPEPSAALLFSVGVVLSGTRLRRRA